MPVKRGLFLPDYIFKDNSGEFLLKTFLPFEVKCQHSLTANSATARQKSPPLSSLIFTLLCIS
jgi:hypothetical protein